MSPKQGGYVSGTLIGLIATILLLVGALAFGGWAFLSRQDYKNNSDQKAAAAADERQKQTQAADAATYAEEAKNPLKTYKGPDQFGSVTIKYPKTWSGYVIDKDNSTISLDGYFHPGVVPDVSNHDSTLALRLQVVNQAYDKVLGTYANQVKIKKLSAKPFTFAKVPSVVGMRLDGQIDTTKRGTLVIVPMRNLTLKVWTESSNYEKDFNKIILANLRFSP